ncbi:MAG: hypothetical protein KDA74_18285, partial [Planctomycetaceae bacterium]|nr:hypothetical protein [Planctomycetaceae bacterium]
MSNKLFLCFSFVVLLNTASTQAADTWTGFRGTGSNISTAANLPLNWSPAQGIRWKQTVPGYGQSSPVVWKDSIFVTSIEGPQQEKCFIHAYGLADGKLLW